MEKIRFITDSASDMNHPREDVTILPLHIRFGDDEYADGVTISHREFYEKLIECDTLPTTSLVSPAVFEDAYEQAVSAGETVIVITISGKLSGTCQSARIAAEDYEGKVFVVDSMNATIGERILVEYGLQLKDQGKLSGCWNFRSVCLKNWSRRNCQHPRKGEIQDPHHGTSGHFGIPEKRRTNLLYRGIHRWCTGHQACGRCLRRRDHYARESPRFQKRQ